MAKFYVDTVSIDSLSRVIKYLSDYADNAQKIPRNAQGQLMFQFGNNVDSLKDRLRDAKKELRTIRDDLDYLAQGLSAVVEGTKDTDAITWALFSDLPKLVIQNVPLIETDYTYQVLSQRNDLLDRFAVLWGEGLVGILTMGIKDITGIEDFDESRMQDSLKRVVASYLKNNSSDYENSKDIVDSVTDTILGLLQQGKTSNEICEILKTKDDLLSKFLAKNKGLIDDICKSAEQAGYAIDALLAADDFLTHILNDYYSDIEVLNNIKEALKSSGYDKEFVNGAIDDLIWQYEEKFMGATRNLLQEVGGFSFDKAVEALGGPVLSLSDFAADIINGLSGVSEEIEHLENVYSTQHYSHALIEQYEMYADKIRSGDYTPEDIEKCDIYFDLALEAKIQEYKSLIEITNDDGLRREIENELERLHNLR